MGAGRLTTARPSSSKPYNGPAIQRNNYFHNECSRWNAPYRQWMTGERWPETTK